MQDNEEAALARLMDGYSLEITARDRASRRAVSELAPAGTDVFVADLPEQPAEVVLDAARALAEAGMRPVPHLVARNIASEAEFGRLLERLVGEAGVDSALVLTGDREAPAGDFGRGVELIESGLLAHHGVTRLWLACFPEGHPHLSPDVLEAGLDEKLDAVARSGAEALLVSQFAFAAEPVVSYARRVRERGVTAPLQVGLAGPASRASLSDFAEDLGAGASRHAVERRRQADPAHVETPAAIAQALAQAGEARPELGLEGVHLFPFGETDACLRWAEARRGVEHAIR